MDEVLAVTPTYNRKVNKGTPQTYPDLEVNVYTTMASCLLEMGFITNDADNKRFDNYFNAYAQAITKGLCGTRRDLFPGSNTYPRPQLYPNLEYDALTGQI